MSKQHHNTLLHIAAQRGFVKLARLQLFNGTLVQPNASGNLPHHVVPTYDENHDELVALLKPQSIFAPGKLVSNLIQWIKSPQLQINDTPMDQHEQALAILQDD
jgi:ankyrin repeat protein